MAEAKTVVNDPVLEILKKLEGFETDAEESIGRAVSSALSIIEDALREAGLCREVDSAVDFCSDTTCRATVSCDDMVYRVELDLSVKATIGFIEPEDEAEEETEEDIEEE